MLWYAVVDQAVFQQLSLRLAMGQTRCSLSGMVTLAAWPPQAS